MVKKISIKNVLRRSAGDRNSGSRHGGGDTPGSSVVGAVGDSTRLGSTASSTNADEIFLRSTTSSTLSAAAERIEERKSSCSSGGVSSSRRISDDRRTSDESESEPADDNVDAGGEKHNAGKNSHAENNNHHIPSSSSPPQRKHYLVSHRSSDASKSDNTLKSQNHAQQSGSSVMQSSPPPPLPSREGSGGDIIGGMGSNNPAYMLNDGPEIDVAYETKVPLLETIELPRGGVSVETQAVGHVQFGIPPETIKDSMRLGISVPSVYIVPVDRFCREMGPALGVNLAEFEFPAYFNFFVQRKRCTLIVDSVDAERNIRRVFAETLLGPAQFRRGEEPLTHEEEGELVSFFVFVVVVV